jgi:CMP-N-acetylneuraminic acid synthetase
LRTIAIIPARGGSKRLKKKNIFLLKGKFLIVYIIEVCKNSKNIDDIYVSSDDDEILSISKEFGAKPLKRDSCISDDYTPKIEVIRAVLKQKKLIVDGEPKIIVIAQANSPEIITKNIDDGLDFMKKHNLWEVMSADKNGVQNAALRIVKANQINNNFLSAHCGFITFDCLDVHTIEDIKKLEKEF